MKNKSPIRRSTLRGWTHALVRRLVPSLLALAAGAALATAPRDRVTLLVPDDADLGQWQVKVWIDSAADEGMRIDVLRNRDFLAMGAAASGRLRALIVPDSAHVKASDAVVAAIKQYAYTGGNLMLVYDAGVQLDNGLYPTSGPSRFSDMVGVNYADYAATYPQLDGLVGFSPVVGTRARLEALGLPPGKYTPYVPIANLTLNTDLAAYVPVTQADPSGTKAMADLVRHRSRMGSDDGTREIRKLRDAWLRNWLQQHKEAKGALRFGPRKGKASEAIKHHWKDVVRRSVDDVSATLNADGSTYTERGPEGAVSTDPTLQAISGYAYGPLNYFHFVTTDREPTGFPGTVYLSSPVHGLVAGLRDWGAGKVLFVNIPLGYFKALGTDGAPLHGFLNHFGREVAGIASMAVQPDGVGGLVFNWHIDDGDDLNTNVKSLLSRSNKSERLLDSGPFSIHLTAGPDVITVGDKRGMNLTKSDSSQDLLEKIIDREPDHAIGSHGGWIHDYWGKFADADRFAIGSSACLLSNPAVCLPAPTAAEAPLGFGSALTPLLQKNFDAIENVTGKRIREYSSPQGNTPLWAVRWLEQRGVVAMYFVGDVGSAALRSYRDGQRLSSRIWSFPVTPLGPLATFEEFDEVGLTDAMSGQWLLDLQSFAINRRTNRLFYAHPPGVVDHLPPLKALVSRAKNLEDKKRFKWYTMTELADFSQRRIATNWTTGRWGNGDVFDAENASGLDGMTWLLPKDRFRTPIVFRGKGTVGSDAKNWVVTATEGSRISFYALDA